MQQRFICLLIALGLAIVPGLSAAPGSVRITVNKKVDKGEKPKPEGEGSDARLVSKATYDITLTAASFSDLANLSVDYIIFIERQKLGQRKNADVVVRSNGSIPVPLLTAKAPVTISTKEIELSKSNLVGNYIYANGGRIKAEDNVKGVWVRVMQDGKIIGEYTNPTTVTARGWEAK